MIEVGKEYYVVSNDHLCLPAMTKVKVKEERGDNNFVVMQQTKFGYEYFSGHVNEYDLLSADEIINVWNHHRMLTDSFERHG